MSDPNDLKPPESETSSRSSSPKPTVGMSIKERMALFNKQAEQTSAPAPKQPPPAIGRKPAQWQPTNERKVSAGEGRSGLSANDAASSISRPGGSLKDRMAALQGAFGSASAPSPVTKPDVKPKPLRQSDDVKAPIEQSIVQPSEDKQDSVTDERAPEESENAKEDGEETDDAEQERVKRQEIAARMAKLGGMRLGGPPMAVPPKKTEETAEETSEAPQDVSEAGEEDKKEKQDGDIPNTVDTNVEQTNEPAAAPEQPPASPQKESKEPIEELDDQPVSMKAPPLARRAKPPRRRTPQTQVNTTEVDTASATPLPDTPVSETPAEKTDEKAVESETASIEEPQTVAAEEPVPEPVVEPVQGNSQEEVQEEEEEEAKLSEKPKETTTSLKDEDHPGSDHLHRFDPQEDTTGFADKTIEDRRISIATALVDKPDSLNNAIEHFHSPLDKNETQAESPKEEIDPLSPLPISQPAIPVMEESKDQASAIAVDDGSSSELSEDYEPVDKKGKGREVSSASAFLGVMNKPLSTPGVEIDDVGVPQHIENLVEHGREEQLIKGAVTDEPVETEEHVDEGRNTVNGQTIEVKNSNEYESIVEDEHIANKPGIAQAQDTNVNDEINDKIPGNDEPVIATTEESAPISEETSRSDNTKNSISERMAKISMAGGFKFGPVPPIPARPVQREAEDEEVEETPQVEKEDVAPEEPVENVHEVKEDVAQPEEAQPEEQPEETDAERRSRIAKKLAASGALRPVLGGDPAPAVPAVQPHNEEEVHEEDGNEVEEVDNDAMKDVADNVQKDLKSDNTSNVGDSITQEKEVRDDEDEPSPPPVPSRDFTNAQDDKRKSIPMPSRELPSLGTAEQPSGDEKKEVIESEPEVEENEDAPPPMPTRSSIVSPPAPVRSVPDLPQAPPARAMPAPPPISTNFESTESKSVETSPVLASPPARVVPAPPSATDTSPPRPPIPKKRTSISSQHSTHRSSIGSVLDHNIPPIPRSPSIKNSPIEQHQRSSIASSIEVPAFPEVPQTVETEEDADSAAERRRHITERLAASGGIRPLVGGLPQPPSRSIPQPDTSGETPEPTEELSEKPETVVDEENPESEAERRARIAKKLAMQGSIRPIFGSVEEQPKEEKAQDESEEEAKQSGSPVMEVEEQPHLETSPQQSLPPPIPKQRPRSFIVPATSIPPPKSPPPTSPPPNPPPPAPPSRQLPRLQSPPSPQSSKHDEVTDEDRRDSTEFVKVPSSSLSVTTPQAERESFEFVASPKDKGIPPSPRSPGKSPIGPRPVGKHIYTHEELVQLAQQVGKKIHEFTKAQYELSKNMPIADGTAIGFVTETLALCNAANDPVNWNFGHLVHAQTTQGLAKRLDDPRPGDVLVLRHAEFKGRKALGNYKASFGAHGPQVAFVTEYDLKKGKVTAIQTSGTPNNYPSLEYISIKFGDLKEGSFEIFRPVPLS